MQLQEGLILQERDLELLGLIGTFEQVSADALTRFVLSRAVWEDAYITSPSARARHDVTRPVRERLVKLRAQGWVNALRDQRGRMSYCITATGRELADLSARPTTSSVRVHPHTIDIAQQVEAHTGAYISEVWKHGCTIHGVAVSRVDGAALAHVDGGLRRTEQSGSVSTTIAVARSRSVAEAAAQRAHEAGLDSYIARGTVTESGYYTLKFADRVSEVLARGRSSAKSARPEPSDGDGGEQN